MKKIIYLLILVIFITTKSSFAQQTVTQGEYFWNTDPGQGNGIALVALDGNFDNTVENLFKSGVSVSTLSVGAHSFNVRVKGFDGSWSNVFKQIIYVDAPLTTLANTLQVTQGEYFWNTDPGQGNGTTLLALDGNFDNTVENLFKSGISVSTLSVGVHSFNVRVKGFDGTWSNVFKQIIYVDAPLTTLSTTLQITQGEYFWNTDPGQGNGTALVALDGNFDNAVENLFKSGISVSTLSVGAHSFNVRVKGFDGTWSNVFKQIIYVDAPLTTLTTTLQVTQGEYFWNTDPGQGNGIVLLALDGNFDNAVENLIHNSVSTVSLPGGPNSFNVRIKGFDGTWSNVFKQTIFVIPTNSCIVTATLSASQTTICAGSTITFSASVTNGGALPSYQWKKNGLNTGSNSSTFTINTLANNDVVTCDIITSDVCAINPLATINSINLTVNPSPTVTITSNNSLLCNGQTAILTAFGANTYTWNTAAVSNSISVTPTINTTYTLIGKDIYGCINTAQITQSVSVCTDIHESHESNNYFIKLFPNPFDSEITIDTKVDLTFVIYNSIGQEILSGHITQLNQKIETTYFAKGLYQINLFSDEKLIVTKKIIKQ